MLSQVFFNDKCMILKIYGEKYEVKPFGSNCVAVAIGSDMVTGRDITALQNNICKKMGIVQVKTNLYLDAEKEANMENLLPFPHHQEIGKKKGASGVNNPIFTFKKENLDKVQMSHPYFNKSMVFGI